MNRIYIKPYMKWMLPLTNAIVSTNKQIQSTVDTDIDRAGFAIRQILRDDLTA